MGQSQGRSAAFLSDPTRQVGSSSSSSNRQAQQAGSHSHPHDVMLTSTPACCLTPPPLSQLQPLLPLLSSLFGLLYYHNRHFRNHCSHYHYYIHYYQSHIDRCQCYFFHFLDDHANHTHNHHICIHHLHHGCNRHRHMNQNQDYKLTATAFSKDFHVSELEDYLFFQTH